MKFQEGDLIELPEVSNFFDSQPLYGIIVRNDGGIGAYGAKSSPYFIWWSSGYYAWYAEKDLIKVEHFEKTVLENLLRHMDKYLNEKTQLFDNLRHIILYNRYRELSRELETYKV